MQGVQRHHIALMCSEENPAACHRNELLGKALAANGVEAVRHPWRWDCRAAYGWAMWRTVAVGRRLRKAELETTPPLRRDRGSSSPSAADARPQRGLLQASLWSRRLRWQSEDRARWHIDPVAAASRGRVRRGHRFLAEDSLWVRSRQRAFPEPRGGWGLHSHGTQSHVASGPPVRSGRAHGARLACLLAEGLRRVWSPRAPAGSVRW